ncbi:Eco57I restriction-modification methylase domain-containing protein [Parabacteroides johnsonii]|uniref:Eco57I restriction-modification methylase domain-containing protein n=1 Tax=Parabacteroides johnsonii TaxID=387661 RepID=UPI003F241B29
MTSVELKNKLSAKFDFEQWIGILREMFPKVEIFSHINQVSHTLVKSGGQVGSIRLDDGRSLAIYTFEVSDKVLINRNRKGLRDIAAQTIDQSIIHGILAFYYSTNVADYRLTYIAKQSSFNENGELITSETAPKRYTFLLGENEPGRTASDRLYELILKKKKGSVYLADVTEAFSVERLNKDFFAGYKAQYSKFLKLLDDTKQNRDYVKKLLGRLVFLQFLQKKGWMGVPASRPDWEGGDKNYLSHLIEHYEGNNRLLSDILEVLFFNTLNEKREGDIADARLGENIKIPYLNGGLFEKDNIDKLDIDFPYSYFKELMDFFSMYNFTVDENDPDDSEVGIDPEMLGHIFENLLEDNKDKGAFYTPKEIVQYMCRQSVIQYLKTHEPNEQYAEPIEHLINDGIVMPILQTKSVASRLIQLLKDVKVCDPAIGSGAFPMGILYVLYHTIHHLQSHAEPNKSFDSTQTKLDIIQNNIFGVDIEQGAVDIARLRFWLALVVDAEKPQSLPNLDYKITCGNSLLNRYAIESPIESVFVEYNKGKNGNEKMTLSKYKNLVNDYTNTSNHQTKAFFRQTIEMIKKAFKTELSKQEKERISNLRGRIITLETPLLLGERTKQEKAELKKLKEKLVLKEKFQTNIINNKLYENAFEWRFEFPQMLDNNGNFVGFDIVIGNPPYNELRDLELDMQRVLKDSMFYESAKGGRLNMYQFFYPLSITIAANHGIITLITQNSVLAEDTALENRKLLFSQTDIISIDSFPERDDRNLRVFESAKMSVCICILRKNKEPQVSTIFPVNVWHSKYMKEKHVLNISAVEIKEVYPEDLIVPISSNEKFSIIKNLKKKHTYRITASSGEIDMTKYKNIFNTKREGVRVITGAQVLRYHITDKPSQGEVIYIANHCIPKFSNKRKSEISHPRIVLQRITGVDSRIRIIAAYLQANVFCANSTNYISPDENINIKYLLAILNSTLINFFVKQTSTNTNITAKVLNSIPIAVTQDIKIQELISELVDYVSFLKQNDNLSDIISNETISIFFEKIIDGCVYELYFNEYMKELEINIIDSALRLIKPISQLSSEKEKSETILNAFMIIKKTDNPIRNRLELFTLRSPELLKLIIED